MDLFERIKMRKAKISVVGLGYVGLPLAVSFAKVAKVVGFDISKEKIKMYNDGYDLTNEVGNEAIRNTTAVFTSDESLLKECQFHIIAVPTPINSDRTPDLNPIMKASEIVGRNLVKNSIVVFESTVYPGVTEEICKPILERESGLKCGIEFKIGYSPERINPGDKVNRLESIVKVVSGMDKDSLTTIAKVYELVVKAGVYKAESIKVAEAAKVIENAQRDINIAFINELSIIFDKLDIDTKSVLEAAATKWNFLKFYPGLVGGHCIGVDPYYLTYKAEQIGYHPQVILSGRRINDYMGKYVAEHTVKKMIQANIQINGSRVAILGITFKENCPDCRNTKVVDIITELKEYGVQVQVVDPVASPREVEIEYGISLVNLDDIRDVNAVVVAVAHNEFARLHLGDLQKLFSSSVDSFAEIAASLDNIDKSFIKPVLIDVKGLFDRSEAEKYNYIYWRL